MIFKGGCLRCCYSLGKSVRQPTKIWLMWDQWMMPHTHMKRVWKSLLLTSLRHLGSSLKKVWKSLRKQVRETSLGFYYSYGIGPEWDSCTRTGLHSLNLPLEPREGKLRPSHQLDQMWGVRGVMLKLSTAIQTSKKCSQALHCICEYIWYHSHHSNNP